MGYFKNPEHEPTRVQKLNALKDQVDAISDVAILEIDGGEATNAGNADIALDGGSA